jgi:hypothetical protein
MVESLNVNKVKKVGKKLNYFKVYCIGFEKEITDRSILQPGMEQNYEARGFTYKVINQE